MVSAVVLSLTGAAKQETLVGSAQRVIVARARASRDQPYSIVSSTSALSIRILSSSGALGRSYSSSCRGLKSGHSWHDSRTMKI